MNPLLPAGLLENPRKCLGERDHAHAAEYVAEQGAEVACIPGNEQLGASVDRSGEDLGVLDRQPLATRPIEQLRGRLRAKRDLSEADLEACFEITGLALEIAPRLIESVPGGAKAAMAGAGEGDEFLRAALRRVGRGEDHIGVEKKSQRLRRDRTLRTRVRSAAVS